MASDSKQKPEASKTDSKNPQPAEGAAPEVVKAKKSLMPLLMLGGGGLALLGLVVFGTLFFVRGKAKQADSAEAKKEGVVVATVDSIHPATPTEKTILAEKAAPSTAQPDSADLLPAQVDTAAAMAALSKTIQVMDEAHQAVHDADSTAAGVEDSVKEAGWAAKAREALAQKELALNARAASLDKREKDIASKLLKLEQATNDRVTNLAKLYDGMEPAAVAKLMANLDDTIVVSLIPRMKQKNASEVMSLIPPARAATISKQIITLADEK